MNSLSRWFLISYLVSAATLASNNQPINILEHLDQQGKIEVCLFTELIFKRFYYTVRLEHVITLLQKTFAHDQANLLAFVTDIDKDITFNHPLIKDSIATLKQHKTLDQLYIIWQDFTTYKFLNDETFLDEFTKLILVISKKLVLYAIAHDTNRVAASDTALYSSFQKGLTGSVQERLDYIDIFMNEFFDRKNHTYHGVVPTTRITHVVNSFTEGVSDRMYYIKRLEHAVDTLMHFKNTKESFFYHREPSRLMFDPFVHFQHEHINYCIEHMESERTPAPMFILWDEFIHYKHLDDKLFLQELIKLIFISYKNIATNREIERENSLQKILLHLSQLYEKIDSLPLEELLNAIDLLAHELPKISHDYELNSTLSWREWLRKYWWSPPLIIGTIAIKALIIYHLVNKKNHSPSAEST